MHVGLLHSKEDYDSGGEKVLNIKDEGDIKHIKRSQLKLVSDNIKAMTNREVILQYNTE